MGKKKKLIFFINVFLAISLGLILPVYQAKAVAPLVGAGIAAAVVYIGAWVMQALSLLTAGLVSLASVLLNFVINDIPWKYTSGGIVDIGWPIMRDFVNMFFVIILVYIGLATALRLGGYGAKKALPVLVIIALLINFTPVISGLIVDASNIVMNFFIKGLDPGAYYQAHIAAQKAMLPTSFWEYFNPFKEIEILLSALILIFTDILAFFIFGIFALLLLARYVAIWILVILSPLAFACYILPQTRGFFSQWWNQFLQWCIFGIFGGFFLYLGTQVMGVLPALQKPPQGATGPVDIFINLLPIGTVLIFYVIGLFASLSTSAAGASYVIRGAKAAGKTAAFKSFGAWQRTTGAIKEEGKRMARTYETGRALGLSRRQAMGEAMRRRWERRIRPALAPKALVKRAGAATWGIVKGIGDVAKAGALAGLGLKLKKRGFRKCPACGSTKVAAAAKFCPSCGYSFE